jgi:hypothetical protein
VLEEHGRGRLRDLANCWWWLVSVKSQAERWRSGRGCERWEDILSSPFAVAFFLVSWTLSAFSRFSFSLSSRLPMIRFVCCWAQLVSIIVWSGDWKYGIKGGEHD